MTLSGSDQFSRRCLIVGDRAPDFEFTGPTAYPLRSCALLRHGPVLLTFYRGAWCTCCRADLRDLMSAMADLTRTRTTVLGVFHELSPEAGTRISREYGLSFPLVDDVNGRAAEAFGIRRSSSEIARIESELGPELIALKEGEPWILPMQARYVIGPNGVIVHSEIVFDYKERSGAAGLIPVLQDLG
jgi:peroxiredoxin